MMRAAMEAAVVAATRAPSVHNTQPWRFKLAADSIELYADFSRQLEVLDPTRRQLYVSCGAALHHLTVALRAAGYDARVTPHTDDVESGSTGSTRLATVAVQPAGPPDPAQLALADAITARHTQREPFAERRVAHETLAELRQAAEAQGAWLAILAAREDQITLAVLLSHADQAELADPDYQAELHEWRRAEPATGALPDSVTDGIPDSVTDGIPDSVTDGIPDSAIPTAGAARHSEVSVRDFTAGDPATAGESSSAADSDSAAAPPDERPALVILGTDADGPTQWLLAGQALSRLLLQATVRGLRASMLGQVIDLPTTRAQLRNQLRLIGEPQMVLRIGYGPAAPATPRRPLTDVLS